MIRVVIFGTVVCGLALLWAAFDRGPSKAEVRHAVERYRVVDQERCHQPLVEAVLVRCDHE